MVFSPAWSHSLNMAATAGVQALNTLGMRSLQEGRYGEARGHFEQAVKADSGNPLLWFHVALACRALGDVAGETAALERSLANDPYFYLAILQSATLLERQG